MPEYGSVKMPSSVQICSAKVNLIKFSIMKFRIVEMCILETHGFEASIL